ncbi:MAG: NUDIX hydrolase [Clostridia bacterium]|nr:NUDIX hydrolase [Clostridia bacterium]
MEFNDKYEKQMISIDISIFSVIDNKLKVLLIKRTNEPYLNMWGLIGGGVYNFESCEDAVQRELQEKLGINQISPILSGVFSEPNRDVRFRNISISYYCMTNADLLKNHNETGRETEWFEINELPNLAFDHKDILLKALQNLKEKAFDINFMKEYLPKQFTLGSLQTIYESILQTSLDKRNFRRKMNSLKCLESTGLKNELDTHKKSEIYKFK